MSKIYDVAVIGGGPAGMMAAGTAASSGASVILLEKNAVLGQKLLITGSGRCNVTNAEKDIRKVIDTFGKNGRFLYPALNAFSVERTLKFFEEFGVRMTEEKNGKLFPADGDAVYVRNALVRYMDKYGVTVKKSCDVQEIVARNGRVDTLMTSAGEMRARNIIIATGGLSYPSTGSTGDGYVWAKALGHSIVPTYPVLTPVKLDAPWIARLEGLSLRDARVSAYSDNKKVGSDCNDAVFTRDGMSGPVIFDLSKQLAGVERINMTLKIDMHPNVSAEELDKQLAEALTEQGKKQVKTVFASFFPPKMLPILFELTGIDPELNASKCSRQNRKDVVKILKELTVPVKGFHGYKRATVTTGGVNLKEVDPKTLRSKKMEGLLFTGEVLDLDAPTGGFNLQMCWSTGYLAGKSAVE